MVKAFLRRETYRTMGNSCYSALKPLLTAFKFLSAWCFSTSAVWLATCVELRRDEV